jgi:hypothetical protein
MVEINPTTGEFLRIFKSPKAAFALEPERVVEWPRAEAIARIRHAIFVRSGGKCEYGCGRSFPEDGPLKVRMHMHEEIPKGNGGEVSLQNGRGICYYCHFGDDRAHGNRKLHFGETTERKE